MSLQAKHLCTAIILVSLSGILFSGCNKSVSTQSEINSSFQNTPTPVVINKQSTPTVDPQGFILQKIEQINISFYSPSDWVVTYDPFANKNYIEVGSKSATMQIFYNQNLTYRLTEDQKSKASQTQNKILQIDNRQISANETELQGGGMILTINLPGQGKKPPVTIWFTTQDRAQDLNSITHLLETLTIK